MKARLRRIALFTKSALFTIVIHGILLVALFVGWQWPFLDNKTERVPVIPIQAQVISAKEIQQRVEAKQKKIEEQQQIAKNLEKLKIKQQQEKKKREEADKQKKITEQKKREEAEKLKKLAEQKKLEETEKKKKLAEQKKREETEKQKKLAEQKKREEAEKKKKLAKQKKREEKEKKKKLAEQKKRDETERKIAEEALQKRMAEELDAKTKADAAAAMSALAYQINEKFKSAWVRPSNSIVGLIATIRVNLSRRGDVLSASVVKSSGNSFFDRSAETAVKKASPLPIPSQPVFYEHIKVLDLEFNPDGY